MMPFVLGFVALWTLWSLWLGTRLGPVLSQGELSVTHESAQPCGCDAGAKWTCEQHRRDPLEDAATELSRAIAEIHDLLREAKTAKDQGRQGAIYYRVVTLQGFLNALVIDARRDLDALKDIPL